MSANRVRMVNPKLPGQPIWTSKPRARLRAGWVEEPEPEPTPETTETTDEPREDAGLSRETKRRRRRAETEGDE